MERNPYSVPAARVADVGPAADSAGKALFFPVSALKLVVMSVVTLGLYELYWFFQNWGLYKKRSGSNIRPFWRAFFAVFYCYSFFSEVRKQAVQHGLEAHLPAGPLAATWIVLSALWRLPDPYWLVSYLSLLALLPVQATANRVNALVAPDHERNSRFSGWNILGLAVGALLMVLIVIGMTVPEAQFE